MSLFDFIRPSKPVHGLIGYFGLTDWWLTTFSEEERHHIQTTFQPLGDTGDSLTSAAISGTTMTAVGLLSSLAGWFRRSEDRSIAHRILEKGAELAKDAPVLDTHFLFSSMIETYYKDRDKTEYMDKAVAACRNQIALASAAAAAFKTEYGDESLPAHKGYQQLVIILEKQGQFQEAIALSHQAESQGWAGDWSNRISRCERKLKKAN